MLTIYTKDFCPYCVRAKAYLDKGGIEYKEVNVLEDEKALAFLKERGHRTVPQIYLNDQLFVEGGCDGLTALDYGTIKNKLNDMDLSDISL